MKNKKNKSIYEVVIKAKKNKAIRSRQWWIKKLQKIREILIKKLKNKKTLLLIKNMGLTLLICDDFQIKKLNKHFRNIGKPTDVLSFHLSKKNQTRLGYLGDIVISFETAKKQAKKINTPIEKEMTLLLIHGYLHLLGYDHVSLKDEKRMFKLQDYVLERMFKG